MLLWTQVTPRGPWMIPGDPGCLGSTLDSSEGLGNKAHRVLQKELTHIPLRFENTMTFHCPLSSSKSRSMDSIFSITLNSRSQISPSFSRSAESPSGGSHAVRRSGLDIDDLKQETIYQSEHICRIQKGCPFIPISRTPHLFITINSY